MSNVCIQSLFDQGPGISPMILIVEILSQRATHVNQNSKAHKLKLMKVMSEKMEWQKGSVEHTEKNQSTKPRH